MRSERTLEFRYKTYEAITEDVCVCVENLKVKVLMKLRYDGGFL